MKERKIELSANLKKYYNIMNRYYNGEFGSKHLTVKEILEEIKGNIKSISLDEDSLTR